MSMYVLCREWLMTTSLLAITSSNNLSAWNCTVLLLKKYRKQSGRGCPHISFLALLQNLGLKGNSSIKIWVKFVHGMRYMLCEATVMLFLIWDDTCSWVDHGRTNNLRTGRLSGCFLSRRATCTIALFLKCFASLSNLPERSAMPSRAFR